MKYLFCLMMSLNLCACAPVNTEFSCHSTASDSCLSIEAVHAMTEVGGDVVKRVQTMWVAPWVDGEGASHQAEQVLAMNTK